MIVDTACLQGQPAPGGGARLARNPRCKRNHVREPDMCRLDVHSSRVVDGGPWLVIQLPPFKLINHARRNDPLTIVMLIATEVSPFDGHLDI